MRGDDPNAAHMFSYISPEQRVPADHPLRPIRHMTDEALRGLSRRFAQMYSTTGRPSIAPEKAAAGVAAADALLDPQRTAAHGTATTVERPNRLELGNRDELLRTPRASSRSRPPAAAEAREVSWSKSLRTNRSCSLENSRP